jgi:predicted sulfurtransferase
MKNFYRILTALVMTLFLTGVWTAAEAQRTGQQFEIISGKTLMKEMNKGLKVLVVDARTAQEYSKGHITGAINITSNQFRSIASALPKDKDYPIVFYCRGYS